MLSRFEQLLNLDPSILFFILAGAFLPTLFWLWFWLKEDRAHPEPRPLLLLCFLGGMAAVILSLFGETYFSSRINFGSAGGTFLFVTIEEMSKFVFAYVIALRSRADDEPIDPLIYMIATALGFAALENTLYIAGGFLSDNPSVGISTGILRFFGATLLHTISSASIGAALGFAFYKKLEVKFLYALGGIIVAIGLHALYNFSIIQGEGQSVFIVLSLVWASILGLILCFERIKKIYPPFFLTIHHE